MASRFCCVCRIACWMCAAALLSIVCAHANAQDVDAKLGTAVTWNTHPCEAVQQARDESKLVFLMHLSGDFAKEAST